jgi:arabinoxylan arabinofuranohydrolase
MVDYRGFSSDDMVNWQDHGVLIHSDEVPWAGNLYAPGACEKNGNYYLYMPNGGDSIGVAVADDPAGPFSDPLGMALLSRSYPGANVTWLFDPACFVDDDGQGYLYFGGGNDMGDNGRVIRLGDDMTSLQDASATSISVPNFYEAFHMHKHDGTYYLQYSADFSVDAPIDYMTSDNPMSGFTFRGTVVENDVALPTQINMSDNNHGSLIDYQGKSYQFYHNRKLTMDLGTNVLNNRSVAVDEVSYGADGTLTKLPMSLQDFTVAQLKCLDGHMEVQAETLAGESGIEVLGHAGDVVRVGEIDAGDWVGYSQVDFHESSTSLVLQVSSLAGGGTIEVSIDGCLTGEGGTSIGTCDVMGTGGAEVFSELSCSLMETSGPHDLCLSFSGDTAFELDSWHLQ